jgi:heptosyltransferase-2/heptosyltransferase-3
MLWQWAGKIRHLRAETALIMRPDHWWGAWLAYLAGIPRRVGYDLPNVRSFLTERLPYTPQHATLQCMELVKPWTGALDPWAVKSAYPITELDRAELAELLAAQVQPGKPIVVIHPGAGTPIKFWPSEHWASVADRLAERLQAVVAFTGSDGEHTQIWQIMDLMRQRGISLAGETNIGQLAALYERALVVIGPDTGPLHLAAASGAPTVHLFGPADPALFGPWGNPARQRLVTSSIACRPCRILDWAGDDLAYHPCIRDITPQQVFEAALAAASQKTVSRPS